MNEAKTLYRSRDEQMLGGVCAGIADYFGLDPTIVRLLAVLLLLVGNAAVVIAYVVLWIVVPEAPRVSIEGGVVMSEENGPVSSDRPGPDSPPPPPPQGVAPPIGSASGAAAPRGASSSPPPPPARSGSGPVWLGVALIFVGVVLLVQMFVPTVALWRFWPMIIIIAGLLVIFRRGR